MEKGIREMENRSAVNYLFSYIDIVRDKHSPFLFFFFFIFSNIIICVSLLPREYIFLLFGAPLRACVNSHRANQIVIAQCDAIDPEGNRISWPEDTFMSLSASPIAKLIESHETAAFHSPLVKC